MKPWQTLTATAVLALYVSGCSSTEEVAIPVVNVSIGQQLIDLKKARDSGALTASEYEKQKANLIASVR